MPEHVEEAEHSPVASAEEACYVPEDFEKYYAPAEYYAEEVHSAGYCFEVE